MKKCFLLLLSVCLSGVVVCQNKTIGKLVILDPAFAELLDKDAKLEVLAEGFEWAEGPVWIKNGGYLLFSDIPNNNINKWKEGEGVSVFLHPSGYTGLLPYSREPGSNGLIINSNNELVACEHGDRRISVMPLTRGGKRTLADNWEGKRFNSPNDIVQRSNGDYYFTDPPYGMPGREKDSTMETGVFGVYRLAKSGIVTLLIDSLLPNGLAFSPDEKILYVGQSDGDKPFIFAYPIKDDGNLGRGRLFFDGRDLIKAGLKGAPDGMKVDVHGNLFSTGPGGLIILDPKGKLLGRIEIGKQTSNCAWGDDGSSLYVTVGSLICKIRTKTKGNGF